MNPRDHCGGGATQELLRVSTYLPSPAIDRLHHADDDAVLRLREVVVQALRGATTVALNSMIFESGAIYPEGYYAGLVEGFVEAIYHDFAAALISGAGLDPLVDSLREIREAVKGALEDLELQLLEDETLK